MQNHFLNLDSHFYLPWKSVGSCLCSSMQMAAPHQNLYLHTVRAVWASSSLSPVLGGENLIDSLRQVFTQTPSSNGWEYRVAYYQHCCQGFCCHVLRCRNREVELDRYYDKNPVFVPKNPSLVRKINNYLVYNKYLNRM